MSILMSTSLLFSIHNRNLCLHQLIKSSIRRLSNWTSTVILLLNLFHSIRIFFSLNSTVSTVAKILNKFKEVHQEEKNIIDLSHSNASGIGHWANTREMFPLIRVAKSTWREISKTRWSRLSRYWKWKRKSNLKLDIVSTMIEEKV